MNKERSNPFTVSNGPVAAVALIILVLLGVLPAFAQDGQGVDLTFDARPELDNALTGGMIVPEPDGKMIALGFFEPSSGGSGRVLRRLNVDGSVDNSFNCVACGDWSIGSVARTPDGKIIVAGSYKNGSNTDPRVWRLNPDGSRDNSFESPLPGAGPTFSVSPTVHAVAPDGRIFITLYTVGFQMGSRVLRRLNADGALDNSFTASSYGFYNTSDRLTKLDILPDGKLLVAGQNGFGKLFRLNNDGTKDSSFDSPVVTHPADPTCPPCGPAGGSINGGVQQPDGKVVFAGRFDSVNALPRFYAARLNADSGVDTATVDLPFSGTQNADIRAQSDGKMIALGIFIDGSRFKRINADLSVDNTYSGPSFSTAVGFWTIDLSNRVVYLTGGSFHRLNTDGSPDATFNSALRAPAAIYSMAMQSDGKVIVGGSFSYMGAAPRAGIARVNQDGTNDPTFDPGTGFNGNPTKILVQTDGKILTCGEFTSYNGTPKQSIVRINGDGSLDGAFTSTVTNLNTIALQADGKIVLGGGSMIVNGFLARTRNGIARLNADGTTDTPFDPTMTTTSMNDVIAQNDGKIAFAGPFSGVNGFNRSSFARLNADGTLDSGFNAGNFVTPPARILRQPDGKYIVAAGSAITRRNADGTVDGTFQAPSFTFDAGVAAMVLAPNGDVVLGGVFTLPKKHIARLAANGTPYDLFLPPGADDNVYSLVTQTDGKIIAGGSFRSIGGANRPSIARLASGLVQRHTPFDFDGDGRADVSIAQPGDLMWHRFLSHTQTLSSTQFGLAGDKLMPADYDGDGKTDIGVFDPPSGWWFKSSLDGQTYAAPFGQPGDIPMPGDIDGDGKADFVIVRNYAWYAVNFNGQFILTINFGQAGDKPITGDFDGDGKIDPAVYRPSTGQFIYAASASGGVHTVIRWGSPDDVPVPADYDGDGKTDAAVFRPSDGFWWVLFSRNLRYRGVPFGLGTDIPVPADYDGDGMADITVFRPSDGNWYFLRTAEGYMGIHLGTSNDLPVPGAFIPRADPPRSVSVTPVVVAPATKERSSPKPGLRTSAGKRSKHR